MSAQNLRTLFIATIAAIWLLTGGLCIGCSSPTDLPEPAAVEEPSSTEEGNAVQATAVEQAEVKTVRSASIASGESVGALSVIRMVSGPDPKAEGQQEFAANSGIWVAFYALAKGAADTDEYMLRVVDDLGAVVALVPLYGPLRSLPDGSESAPASGGLVVHAAVPVFGAGESPPAGDYRSEVLLNGSVEADFAWSVTP